MDDKKHLEKPSKKLSNNKSNDIDHSLTVNKARRTNDDGDPGAVGGISRGPMVMPDKNMPVESRIPISAVGFRARLEKLTSSKKPEADKTMDKKQRSKADMAMDAFSNVMDKVDDNGRSRSKSKDDDFGPGR